MTEQQNLMRRLQIQDFVITDINLYLDTHPTDQAALEYYKKYRDLRSQTATAYIKQFGPITPEDVYGNTWTWVESPWPWEGCV
ncbi:spore coat protein CotJB [Sinanaerobacter sp. ZZT-01]|uniref:spore coat protein CotJB n=1 Tax=Sinanaerobacter sp. ZZT-01 TaxID=3111540 RepID=UPI002D768B63|nr:spore coat protein CotJB [Sinanaerobacter sp. ZZT-01]WRR94161.1 spore coat protein CotJB [Sinanaerobacter sp. ZZT-01]